MATALSAIAIVLTLVPPASLAGTVERHQSDDVVGGVEQVLSHYDDTLMDIARRHGLGYWEIKRANPTVDVLLPGEGTPITLPKQFILPDAVRQGIVLNLAEMRLYYFPDPAVAGTGSASDMSKPEPNHYTAAKVPHLVPVITFPVGIGQPDWQTPTGQTLITNKVKNPSWTPPASIRAAYLNQGIVLPEKLPPGPDNPLGKFALRLSNHSYLIHGTNKPDGIGMQVSHGCIRLYPEDIKALFDAVPLETTVNIVDQPYKVGWLGKTLLLEAHPAAYAGAGKSHRSDLIKAVIKATRYRHATIDWQQVEEIRRTANGIPQTIGQAADTLTWVPDI